MLYNRRHLYYLMVLREEYKMSLVLNQNSMKKATEVDLVDWFLLKESMSQKKIQKLAYYAQAWSLVFLDQDIVQGIEFEAWVHGPVNYKIRTELAKFGWNDICFESDDINPNDIISKFSKEQNEVLEEVWNVYGTFTANQLEILTHREEPWLEKRVGLETFESSSNKISNETMKKYYSKKIVE